jgi:hypothetical protein
MTAELIATAQGREDLLRMVPMPLNGIAEPIAVARLLSWLGGQENTHLCGQVIYIDGGSDVVLRATPSGEMPPFAERQLGCRADVHR